MSVSQNVWASGLFKSMWQSARGAAAGAAYLLRATFTGANQALADGNTLGSGGTYTDYVEDGLLTVAETSDGALAISSNKLAITTPTSGSFTTRVTSGAITRVAGMPILATMKLTTETGTTAVYQWLASTTAVSGARLYQFYPFSTGGALALAFSEYGASEALLGNFVVSGTSPSFDTEYKYATVLGGFDSSGVPDATGDYGARCFWHDGSNWNLVAVGYGANDATLYLSHGVNTNAAQPVHTVDDIKIPDGTTVAEVFAPTDYVLDTFSGGVESSLPSHTPDSGGPWNGQDTTGRCKVTTTGYIQAVATHWTASAGNSHYIDGPGNGDHLMSWNQWRTAGGGDVGAFFRDIEHTAGNAWMVQQTGTTFRILEWPSVIQRASVTVSAIATASPGNRITVRANAGLIESWRDGANKISYSFTPGGKDDLTNWAPHWYNTGSNAHWDNVQILPLTSTDYDTALDAI